MEQHSILIVDNDNIFARTLAQALFSGFEGTCQVELCSSAKEAYSLLVEQRFDLLIASFDLPGEDGLSLIDNSQERKLVKETILLADEECPDPEERAEVNKTECLTRPFDILDFLLIVQQVLSPSINLQNGDQPFKLLLLEDDEGLRRIYSLALSKFEACQIDQAATMDEARSLLDNQDYDILISDIRIGRDRATDILAEYRNKLVSQGTKIVMCSAFGQYRNLPEEVDHFLEKPISVDKLVNLVGQLAGFHVSSKG